VRAEGRASPRGTAPRRGLGRVPVAVRALVALHGLTLVLASVLFPTYRAPDESAHVDMVVAVAQGAGYPEVGQRRISQRVIDSFAVVGHVREGEAQPLRAADAPARGERPRFADLGPDVAGDVRQQMAAHPPLYYLLAAAALSGVTAVVPFTGDWSFDQVVGFLRLFSALVVLPLPLIAYLVAGRLGAPRPAAVTAAVLPLGVPQLTHVGASVNNDTLLVLLLGLLTLPTLAVARGDRSWRTAAVAGLLGGLALLTKGFALFVPLWLAAVYGLGVLRGAGWRGMTAGALSVATAVAVGGWWWIRNLVVHGTVQPAGLPGPPAPEGFTPDVGFWLPFYVERLSHRFWIEPNIVPDGAPPLHLLATLVVVMLCVAAFAGCRRTGQSPADLTVVLAPLAGLGGIVTFGAWRVYARTGTPFAIHGRYLYGAVVGIAVVGALGAFTLLGARSRRLPFVALAVVVVVQATAAGLALVTYWGPPGARGAAVLAWSPWPALFVVGALAGAVALVAWLVPAFLDGAAAQRSPQGAPRRRR